MQWASRALQGRREKVVHWVPQALLALWDSQASQALLGAKESTALRERWVLPACLGPTDPRDHRACRGGVAPPASGVCRVRLGWRGPPVPKETLAQRGSLE